MKQVLQHLRGGNIEMAEVPCAVAGRNQVLIRTTRSLISAGTERMLVDFSKAGWIDKARQQPEKVAMVLDKVKADGLLATVDAVRSKLDQPLAMGYCNVGRVVQVGSVASGFSVGDRVVSNGNHAEFVSVSRNLCALIPDSVSDDEASFTVLGAIALQGIRLVSPTLGEGIVVMGLGLIGLITVQLLRANGCRVLGIDPDPVKAEMARKFGADVVALDRGEDPMAIANAFSQGQGVDGVLITAATTSNEPMSQAAKMCRKRGRVVLIGVVGLDLDRSDFYNKEISFQVSCSYGPGRYDPEYEGKGNDYPIGFVRWTEQRNFVAVLEMIRRGSLQVKPLVSHRFAFEDAPKAYDLLTSGLEPYIGILLEYGANDTSESQTRTIVTKLASSRAKTAGVPRVGIIGAGNYAGRVLMPAFAACGADLAAVASNGGVTAAYFGKKFHARRITTDADSLLSAPDIDAVVVATRHDSHARFVIQALQNGKHVFVEKPVALNIDEIERIEAAWKGSGTPEKRPHVMVGFNRRFAPQVARMKTLLMGVREPKIFVITVNAGAIPADHWVQDPLIGGGRIVGEGCHFVDLLRHLAGNRIAEARVTTLGGNAADIRDDKVVITLTFADGSLGTIHYLANGHSKFPKERVEVFCAGRILQLDNFRSLRGYGWPGFSRMNLWRQDKGQNACVQAFVDALREGRPTPIPFDEIVEVGRVVIALGEAARG